jgi:hypothetical protein
MPNDAKLGLVAGVVLVIAVGVVFFRNAQVGVSKPGNPSATIVKSVTLPPPGARP